MKRSKMLDLIRFTLLNNSDIDNEVDLDYLTVILLSEIEEAGMTPPGYLDEQGRLVSKWEK